MNQFRGVFTALVTPFLDGKIDFPSLEKLIDQQLGQGIQGFVVCGTTGESPTLSRKEQFEILKFVCDKVEKKVPILFGSGSNSTETTIETSQQACEYNIDGLLVVVPYYNKPPQPGLRAHFEKVADACEKPIVLYNVPGRTVAQLEPETIIDLSQHSNIAGIKEANSDLNNFSKYKSRVADGFSLLSGDDESCINFCFLGGHGVISVCSHLMPGAMVQWVERSVSKDESVRDEFRQHLRWIQNLYISANPIPVKAALFHKNILASKELRLPLMAMDSVSEQTMLASFKDFRELAP